MIIYDGAAAVIYPLLRVLSVNMSKLIRLKILHYSKIWFISLTVFIIFDCRPVLIHMSHFDFLRKKTQPTPRYKHFLLRCHVSSCILVTSLWCKELYMIISLVCRSIELCLAFLQVTKCLVYFFLFYLHILLLFSMIYDFYFSFQIFLSSSLLHLIILYCITFK